MVETRTVAGLRGSPAVERPSVASGEYVLVVDDESAISDAIQGALEFEGYRVTTAGNGIEALDELDREQPDLVLLDMRMPVLDGWGFAWAVSERALHVPICVMTATINARTWAAEIHAAGYLAKPFELAELLGAVDRCLR